MSSTDTWRRAILSRDGTIEDAIRVLNDVALKVVLVTDKDGALIGTISDGDIRRGLLKGFTLASPVQSIIHKEPISVSSKLSREAVIQLMAIHKIQQIPIIDEHGYVTGLYVWDEVIPPLTLTNTMVIMAGGKGSRLYPRTQNCPKPLLPIGGKPILQHIIERAKANGFSNIILAVHYLGHMIEDYFGDGSSLGVRIKYIREDSPLGTAGALTLLDPIPTASILITNGDVITDVNYADVLQFHQQNNSVATMGVRLHEWENPFGVVKTNGIVISGYEEKPISHTYINAGVYVLEPSALGILEKSQPVDMPTLFERLASRGQRTIAYAIHEPWFDIGQPTDLETAIKMKSIDSNPGDHD